MNDERRALSTDDADRLARYLEERLSEAERQAFEQEILERPEVAEAFYQDVSLQQALEGSTGPGVDRIRDQSAQRPPSVLSRRPVRTWGGAHGKWIRIALPAAAVLALVLVIPQIIELGRDGDTRRLRSGTRTPSQPSPGAPSVRGISPAGDSPTPPSEFRWTRDPRASAYRIEIRSESGAMLLSRTTPDTVSTFPDGLVTWQHSAPITWRVVPLVGGAEGVASEPVIFRVMKP